MCTIGSTVSAVLKLSCDMIQPCTILGLYVTTAELCKFLRFCWLFHIFLADKHAITMCAGPAFGFRKFRHEYIFFTNKIFEISRTKLFLPFAPQKVPAPVAPVLTRALCNSQKSYSHTPPLHIGLDNVFSISQNNSVKSK